MTEEQRRAIEAAVTRLIHAYAWANDAQDWDACAALYTEDAMFRRPSGGEPIVGRAAILASFTARAARAQRHVMANVLVDVASEREARARSVVVLYMGDAVAAGLPVQDPKSPLVGTFVDRCVLTDEGWRFAERTGALDFRP
ncbi:MAG: nuclear transport factor 2 family protein [Erythrobacter sp.]|nr:MAG: nuclear transport factor 2 family protein [Erythrobacter sp.]